MPASNSAGSGRVDILDAQQEPPRAAARSVFSKQRRIGMAQMQPAGGAGRESGDEWVSGEVGRNGAMT